MRRVLRRNMISKGTSLRLEEKVMLAGTDSKPLVVGPRSTSAEFQSALARHNRDGTRLTLRSGIYDTAAKRSNIEKALSQASEVEFQSGTYTINERINVTLGEQNKLSVNAAGATFKSDGVDGDLIRIAGGNSSRGRALAQATTEAAKSRLRTDIEWTGGVIDISGSKVAAKYRPKGNNEPKGSDRIGTSATTDGLSIKGAATGNKSDHAVGSVTIKNVEINGVGVGSRNRWDKSGGDSGLFITDAIRINVSDSKFIGARDAGVYISDKDGVGTESVIFENNLFDGNHDGFAAKRGIDNVTLRNNTFLRNETSVAFTSTPDAASNTTRSVNGSITGNFIASTDGTRGILLQNTDARVQFNGIYRGYNSNAGKSRAKDRAIELDKGTLTNSGGRDDNTVETIKNAEINSFNDALVTDARSAFRTDGSRNTVNK